MKTRRAKKRLSNHRDAVRIFLLLQQLHFSVPFYSSMQGQLFSVQLNGFLYKTLLLSPISHELLMKEPIT